ncbi:MAG: putative sulfate exporter family transporter, partial [Saprospiraceae bacterium]
QSNSKQAPSGISTWSEDIWAVCIGSIILVIVLSIAIIFKESTFKSPSYQWSNGTDLAQKVFSSSNLLLLLLLGFIYSILSFGAIRGKIQNYLAGLGVLFLLAILSLIIAGNKSVNGLGIEYIIFALMIGLTLSNLNLAPIWLKAVARSEFFIKTGLIILGSSVLFTDIIKAGLPGIIQAIVVVLVVWFFALWLCRKLKVDDEFGVIIASAVSICGVSAAIVASGAIQGDKKKLSYVTTLVLIVAIPMLILQPWIIRYFNISELVGGAWLGGTLDTTASVTAAAQLVGPIATKAGVIIKFSQNVLIGFAAFFIATWWAYRKNNVSSMSGKEGRRLIWDRFPKFVLGFIAVSLLFSFVISPETGNQVSGFLNSLRTLWFALAFVSIGLEANFSELFKIQSGRPAIAFIGAQVFNIFWTLLWAYLLFGGLLLPVPDIQ